MNPKRRFAHSGQFIDKSPEKFDLKANLGAVYYRRLQNVRNFCIDGVVGFSKM
jgi:hypothetical protein